MSEKRALPDGGDTGGVSWLGRLWLSVANSYERYRHLDPEDKVALEWHGWGTILTHWSMVLLLLLTATTGIVKWLGWYGPLNTGIWGGYYVAFLIHVWTGILLAVWAFVLYPYYSLVVDGKSVLISLDQVREQIVIVLALFGLASYIPGYKQARRTYDEEAEEWVGHHPVQTAFWYATWGFVAILTLTGFALWAALETQPTGYVAALGFLEGWLSFETLLRIHLVSTFFFLASVAIHAYVAILPGNRDLLVSMLNGRLKGWRVDDETRPEPRGGAASKDGLANSLAGISRRLGTGPELQSRLDGPTRPADAREGEPGADTDTEEPDSS